MGEGLAAAVAGGTGPQLARRQPVVHQPDHDAVLDQHRARGRCALIVDRQGAATACDRAVVHDRHARGGDPLAHHAGEDRRSLAVEIALEAVADGFVQQHPGPARAQHHIHLACRTVDGFEIDQGLPQGLVDLPLPAVGGDPGLEPGPAPGTGRGALALAVLLDRDRDVQSDQRADVGDPPTIAAQNLDVTPLADHAGRHLDHARVPGPCPGIDLGEQGDLVGKGRRGEGVDRRIELLVGRAWGLGGHPRMAGAGQARAVGGASDGGAADLVGVGIAGGLSRHHAQAEALGGVIGGGLQPAVVEHQ